jgi:hypothetical protein
MIELESKFLEAHTAIYRHLSSMTKSRYVVFEADHLSYLERLINEAMLSNPVDLLGGVAVSVCVSGQITFYQAACLHPPLPPCGVVPPGLL